MFIAAVSSISLAVFTDLSIMQLDNAKLASARDGVPAIEVSAPAATADAASTSGAKSPAVENISGDATASVWAKDEVKRHSGRD